MYVLYNDIMYRLIANYDIIHKDNNYEFNIHVRTHLLHVVASNIAY